MPRSKDATFSRRSRGPACSPWAAAGGAGCMQRVEWPPTKRHDHVLMLGSCKCGLIWKKGLCKSD